MGYGSDARYGARYAVTQWYQEVIEPGIEFSDDGKPRKCEEGGGCTGHMDQVLCKETRWVGMACDKYGKGLIVANYFPARVTMTDNVFPLGTPVQERSGPSTEP